jgi:MinD-like ATPase involved in chromosome partitioning or flagellar assembly
MSGRLTILSVGRARATWPRDVARWATSGLLPVDHHPCLSPDELEGRLAEAGGVDVVLLDGGLTTIGRELIRRSAERGSAVLVIDAESRNWVELGATAVTPAPDDPESLRRLLEQLRPAPHDDSPPADQEGPRTSGRLIAVTGHGGAGTSTIAHGLALRWADPVAGRDVLLADFSLRADQHVHHDLIDPGPGVLDLVAGHERSTMASQDVRGIARMTDGGHRLLTGVRHSRDWTALPPGAVGAAVESLRAAFDVIVADIDDDTDGRAETGSTDLEERNGLTRACVRAAAAVVVVARADLLGVHRLCRHVEALTVAGIDAGKIHVVANGARRRTPSPGSLRRDVAELLGRSYSDLRLVSVPHLAGLEARRRDALPPGQRLRKALTGLDHLLELDRGGPTDLDPLVTLGPVDVGVAR